MLNCKQLEKVSSGITGGLTVFRGQRKTIFLLMLFLLFGFAATVNAAPTVLNPSFEYPDVAGYEYNPSGTDWSRTGALVLVDSGSAFGNTAYAGNQNLVMQGITTIYQSVSGFEVGHSYEVTWAEADRPGAGGNDFRVRLGGTTVYALHTAASTSWEVKTSAEFTATSTTHTLEFVALNSAGGDRSVFIDAVSIDEVAGSPPGQASNPTPTNGATGLSLNANLSWTAGTGASSHDVYFGEDSTPDAGEFQGNQAGTTYDTGTMSNDTTYYWRIDEVGSGETTTGDVWSFTTASSQVEITDISF